MIPPRFEYLAPTSLDQAISMLDDHGPEAKVLAGGQSLIPMMKLQLAAPAYIVDINRIPGLEDLYEDDEVLHIGSLTREAVLDASQLIRTRYPILHDTAAVIADPLVRNLATVGGNLAHGDPANDHPATMLALGAQVTARGPRGDRTIPLSEFFEGPLTTALEEGEILTEIQVRALPPGSGSAYLKLERKVGDYATAGVAVVITMRDGVCQQAGIGLTNAGPTPIKAASTESFLVGRRLDDETISEAARLTAQAAHPSADLRGSAEYKRDMVRVLTGRAIRLALARISQGPLQVS
jgi:carbon-monoxide dehydrogenase medium subunit